MDFGLWTLLPIIVVIVLALLTKRTLEPLIVGTVVAYIIICGWNFPTGWMEAFFKVATDRDHEWVFMVCALFGSLIALLGASLLCDRFHRRAGLRAAPLFHLGDLFLRTLFCGERRRGAWLWKRD